MPHKTTTNAAKDKLLAELQVPVVDTKKLLQSAADVAGDQAEEIHGGIHDSLKRARDTLRDTENSLKDNVHEHSQATADATEVYADEHPRWNIGITAGVGLLLGLLVSRRRTMSEGGDPADGRPSLRHFGATFLGLLHGHVELFGIELQGQKVNTLRLLLFAGLALVFALPLLVDLSPLALITFWDTNWLAVAFRLRPFYVTGSLFCGWRLYQSINDESSPFSAALEELANDHERLLPWQGNAHGPTTGEHDRLVAS